VTVKHILPRNGCPDDCYDTKSLRVPSRLPSSATELTEGKEDTSAEVHTVVLGRREAEGWGNIGQGLKLTGYENRFSGSRSSRSNWLL